MNDRQKVAKYLIRTLSTRFSVVDNLSATDKKLIAAGYPDVIVYKKDSTADADMLFVMKIENGGELIDSLPQWKELTTTTSTFYIVVPIAKLPEAKKLAGAASIKAKFAWYEMASGEVTNVSYE
jgi:hypothetical protein